MGKDINKIVKDATLVCVDCGSDDVIGREELIDELLESEFCADCGKELGAFTTTGFCQSCYRKKHPKIAFLNVSKPSSSNRRKK